MLKKCFEKNKYILLSFIMATICVIVAFSLGQRMFFSEYVIMDSDMYAQSIPFYKMMLNKIFLHNDLFDNGRIFYSFQYGMGSDISLAAMFYALLSPLNIIYVVVQDINLATILIVIIRLGMSAAIFNYYLKKMFKMEGMVSCVFSVLYALCGYSVVYYMLPHFIIGLELLPLVIAFINDFYNEQSKGKGLSVIYAYLFIVSAYSAFLVGLISFIYFVLCNVIYNLKDKRKFLRVLFLYLYRVILSLAVSSFILFPAISFFVSNKVSDATTFNGITLNVVDFYSNLFMGAYQSLEGNIPYIYSGLIILILFPVFFIKKDVAIKEKAVWGILLVFSILSCFVSALYYAMHFFDAPDMFGYRFSYVISFVLITISVRVFNDVKNMSSKYFVAITIINVLVLGFSYFINGTKNGFNIFLLEINIILLFIYLIFFVKFFKAGKYKAVLPVLIMLEMIFNIYLIMISSTHTVISNKDFINKNNDQIDSAITQLHAKDNSFYRVFVNQEPNNNYHMKSDYYSAGLFSSFENERLRNTLYGIGLESAVRNLTEEGLVESTSLLLGYKYYVDSYGILFNKDVEDSNIFDNQYYAGIGYMVSDDIYSITLDSNNPFENQNIILNSFGNAKNEYWISGANESSLSLNNINVYYSAHNTLIFQPDDMTKDASAVFEVNSDYDNLYAYVPQADSVKYLSSPFYYTGDGSNGRLKGKKYVSAPSILKLQKNQQSNYQLTFSIAESMVLKYFEVEDILYYSLDYGSLDALTKECKNNEYVISEFKDGYIKGNVDVKEDKTVLYLSVPYDKSWDVYVDGKKSEIQPVINDTFISVNLPAGNHEVIFEYNNRFGQIGICITVEGIVLLLLELTFAIRKRDNHSEESR